MIKIGVITMALVSFLNAGWLSGWFDKTPPFVVDINLGQTGYIAEKKFKIKKGKTYVLGLTYDTSYEKVQEDPTERRMVDRILFGKYRTDEKWITNGYRISIPIKITISGTTIEKKPFIFEKIYFTSDGLKTATFNMHLDNIKLAEGSYKIEIEILDGLRELVGIPMYIIVRNIRKIK